MDVKVNEDSFDILKAPSGISTPQWEAITNVESVLDEAKRKIMEERSKKNMKMEDVQPHEVLQPSDGEEQEALLHSVEAQLEEREIPGITGYKEKEEEEELYYEELEQELMKLMKQPILTPEDLKDGHSARKMKETLELESEAKKIGEDLIYCMGLRDKYQKISVQLEGDNPKNSSEWEIYPPPPPRAWKDFKKSANIKSSEFNFSECKIPGAQDKRLEYELVSDGGDFDGTYRMYNKDTGETTSDVPGVREYYKDLKFLHKMGNKGPMKSWTYKRLKYLENKYQMYVLLKESQENMESKMVPHRDFYNVRKVDTHVHLASCMNQKHLLRFIKHKVKTVSEDEVVYNGMTLKQVFESLKLTAYDLSIDTLDMHSNKQTFHRFDKFNLKYNPIGESKLRTIFLKTDNDIKGRYLAELTKEVFSDLEVNKYQKAEYRVSIYGNGGLDEWSKLAAWVIDNKVISNNVRWLIQIPRLYNVYKKNSRISDFKELIYNIFEPLFRVTKDPTSNPKLHVFLQRVVGFDSVDDESKPEKNRGQYDSYIAPSEWNGNHNPPYSYYSYYIYANMAVLNQFRKVHKFNTFVFRPHAGEAGDIEHLASSYLLAQSISHGIMLRKAVVLQYLFYLNKIGIAMSPLSNNALFLSYERNPFYAYFMRGLNVSLSTDDPLQFHFTKEPLIEEYSIAAQIYKLSNVDMCELALNSVLQSGFETQLKNNWVGEFNSDGGFTPHVQKTNVPASRLNFRNQTYNHEVKNLFHTVQRL